MRHRILHPICLVTCVAVLITAAHSPSPAKPLGRTRRQNREVHDRHGAQMGRRRLHE